jgi:hypothetical protein
MARLQASRQMLQQAGRSVFEGFSSYFSPSGSSGLPTGLSADDYYATLKGYRYAALRLEIATASLC